MKEYSFPSLELIQNEYLHLVSNPSLEGVNFPKLSQIGGYLRVNSNLALKNLAGFSALERVGGEIRIISNASLANLDDFSKLNQLGGALRINSNSSLKTVNGFNELGQIGLMHFNQNNALVEIKGFTKFKTATANISIWENTSLSEIKFDALETITRYLYLEKNGVKQYHFPFLKTIQSEYLYIVSNPLLEVIDFPNLEIIGNYWRLDANPFLKTINGFTKIVTIGGNLLVQNNERLVECCVLEPVITNSRVGGTTTIRNNQTPCDSELEIQEKCSECPVGDTCDDGDFSTTNDKIDADCNCVGEIPPPVYECPLLMKDKGDSCDDNNDGTINDEVDDDCNCVGEIPPPVYECPLLMKDKGDSCDDNNQ